MRRVMSASTRFWDQYDDDLERRLRRDDAETDPEVRAFLRDYSQCKRSTVSTLLPLMFGLIIFEPPHTFEKFEVAPLPELETKQDELRFGGNESLARWLRVLRTKIVDGSERCLRIW